jgi:hypothetical protein
MTQETENSVSEACEVSIIFHTIPFRLRKVMENVLLEQVTGTGTGNREQGTGTETDRGEGAETGQRWRIWRSRNRDDANSTRHASARFITPDPSEQT